MESKKFSLSKKIDGGYLHISKRGSNVKKRTGKGGGYSNYLNRLNGLKKGGSGCDTNRQEKVVSIQLAGSKKYKSPKKQSKEKQSKDISTSMIEPQKVQPKKVQPKKGIPIALPTAKGSLKKRRISRSRCRSNSLTKRRCHDLKKGGKRISVSKIRHLSKKDVNNIQSKLKSIKGKSNEDIKKELDKQGIQVSGKSPSILKDIYMYSQLCGINIKRE
jgi:hypothetical protein